MGVGIENGLAGDGVHLLPVIEHNAVCFASAEPQSAQVVEIAQVAHAVKRLVSLPYLGGSSLLGLTLVLASHHFSAHTDLTDFSVFPLDSIHKIKAVFSILASVPIVKKVMIEYLKTFVMLRCFFENKNTILVLNRYLLSIQLKEKDFN